MKESGFQKLLKQQLESVGAVVLNFHGHEMQRPGIPDLYVSHRRFKMWLELKTEKGRLSGAQRQLLRQLDDRGELAFCARLDGARHLLLERWDGGVVGRVQWRGSSVVDEFSKVGPVHGS